MITSHSEVESFLTCSRQHFYGYGLRLTGKTISDALYKGNIGHAALEAYYRAHKAGLSEDDCQMAAYEAIDIEGAKYEVYDKPSLDLDVINLLVDYFKNYSDFHKTIEVLEVELELTVQVTDDYAIPMKCDLIYRRYGKTIAEDHKFSYDFYNPDVMDINPQLPKYFGALKLAGYTEINSVGYNEVRTRSTKDNKINPSEKFRRTPVQLTAHRVKTTMREQIRAAKKIAALRSLPLDDWEDEVLRIANANVCKSCPFKTLCANDLNGYPRDNVIEYGYKVKEKRR